MLVRGLRLYRFRNYAAAAWQPPPGLVAVTGDNGQGKTNLLEAICVLATTRSPLTEHDRELLEWDSAEASLAAEVESGEGNASCPRQLEIRWRRHGNGLQRSLLLGGAATDSLPQWLGELRLVAFFPHDLVIVAGEPDARRRFMNLELGKASAVYFMESAHYRRALQQRNALLRAMLEARRQGLPAAGPAEEGHGTLGSWNRQVVTHGARVLEERSTFIQRLNPLLEAAHRQLSGDEASCRIEYLPGLPATRRPPGNGEDRVPWREWMAAALEGDRQQDLRRGITHSGPHRDDLRFLLDGMDLRRYGSQGQQRLAVLALKIALCRWVRTVVAEAPVLLLDDALSELDSRRRGNLLAAAAEFPQTILTATDPDCLEGRPGTAFSVSAGKITSLG